jgi:hypothetical protein
MADSTLAKNAFQGFITDVASMSNPATTARQALLRRRVSKGITDGGTAASAAGEIVMFRAEVACTVISVHYCGGVAITADNTNNATFLVQKRPASAPGTPATVATASTAITDPTFGANYAAFTPLQLPNSGTAANLAMAAGDVLTVKATKGASGVAFGAAATATGATAEIAVVIEEAY